MARIAPASRIARTGRFIERPKTQITRVSAPTPTAQLTTEQIAQQEKQFYAQRGSEQTVKLATKIKSEQAKVERYREQLSKAKTDWAMESAENRLIRAEETLGAYQSMRDKASSGKYRYVDLISSAQSEGIYRLEVQQFKAKQQKIQVQVQTKPISKAIGKEPLIAYKNIFTGKIIYQSMSPDVARARGLVPIEVTGYGGKEIVSETLLAFRRPELYAPPKQYFESSIELPMSTPVSKPPPKQEVIIQKLKTRDTYSTGGRTYFYQNGELTSVKGRSDTLARFFETRVLGTDPSLTPKPKFKTGEEFSLRYSGLYFAKKLSDIFTSKYDWGILERPAPEWLVGISAELPTWMAFSPFMKSGTFAKTESEYAWDVKTQKFIRKSDLEEYLSGFERVGKEVRFGKSLKYQTKAERVRHLLRNLKNPNDPASVKRVMDVARETYGSEFVKDFTTQEAGKYAFTTAIKTTTPPVTTIPTTPYIRLEVPPLPTMRGASLIGTSVSTKPTQEGKDMFKPSMVGETQWKGSGVFADTFTGTDIIQISKTTPKQRAKTKQDIFQQTKSGQDIFQQTKQGQDTFQQTRTIQDVLTKQKTKQQLKQKLKSIFAPTGTLYQPFPKTPIRGLPFWFFGRKKAVLPGVSKVNSYIPQVRHKKKWKTIGKRMDRNSALSRASKGADLSTSRRMRILPSKKAPQVINLRGWGMRRHKFRNYRIVKNRRIPLKKNTFIESTKYAIDTPTEKAQLSIAQISKRMDWLGTQTKKKKKVVRRRKSGAKRKNKVAKKKTNKREKK